MARLVEKETTYVVGGEALVEFLQRDNEALAGLAGVSDLHFAGAFAVVGDFAGGKVESTTNAFVRANHNGVGDVGRTIDLKEERYV